MGKCARHPAALSKGSDSGEGASWSSGRLHVAGRQGGLRGLLVEVFLCVVETVTQNSGNWDSRVPREACLGRL